MFIWCKNWLACLNRHGYCNKSTFMGQNLLSCSRLVIVGVPVWAITMVINNKNNKRQLLIQFYTSNRGDIKLCFLLSFWKRNNPVIMPPSSKTGSESILGVDLSVKTLIVWKVLHWAIWFGAQLMFHAFFLECLFFNALFFGRASGTIYGDFAPTGPMKGGPRERYNHLTEQGWLQGFQSLSVFPNELRHCCLLLNSLASPSA